MKINRQEFIFLIKLGRLHLVTSTLLFYFLGILLAVTVGYNFKFEQFLIGLLIATTAIISMSYSNNYFDAKSDKNNKPTSFSGGSIDLINNKKLFQLLKPLALFFMGLSILFSIPLILLYSYPFEFFFFVIAGNLLAWYYAAPPLKFAYRGLGEIITIITVGLMLPGLGFYIIAGSITIIFAFFIIPILLLVLMFILNAEIPDVESDRLGKKNNLIIRKNPHFGLQIVVFSGVIILIYSLLLSLIQETLTNFIDFRVITILSVIPLSVTSISINSSIIQKYGTLKLVLNNLTSILLVIFLINVYLLLLIIF